MGESLSSTAARRLTIGLKGVHIA